MLQLKKGDVVYEVGPWNRTGMIYVRRMVVESCGKRQGTLRVENTGDMNNSFFRPSDFDDNGRCTLRGHFGGLYSGSKYTQDEVNAIAEQHGADYIASLREQWTAAIASSIDPFYVKAMRKNLDSLLDEPELHFL